MHSNAMSSGASDQAGSYGRAETSPRAEEMNGPADGIPEATVARLPIYLRALYGLAVRHVDELEAVVARHNVAIGVIATPAGSAQAVCDRFVSAGVTSILNFAPLVLSVPEGVDVRKVDLSIELQILAFHAQRRSAARPADAPGHHGGNAGAAGQRSVPQVPAELAAQG